MGLIPLHRPHSTHSILFNPSSYVSVVLLITGSYVFWEGPGLSDDSCRRLTILPSAFKCAHALPTNPSIWLKCPIIRSASYDCTTDHGLEVCAFFVIHEYRESSSPRSFPTGHIIFHGNANLCFGFSAVYILRLSQYVFPPSDRTFL